MGAREHSCTQTRNDCQSNGLVIRLSIVTHQCQALAQQRYFVSRSYVYKKDEAVLQGGIRAWEAGGWMG